MKIMNLLIIFESIILLTSCAIPAVPIENPAEIKTDPQSALSQENNFITVTSTSDNGLGTLRQALQDVQSGGTIIFDPNIFRPDEPAEIMVESELPHIRLNDLTIDASNAGVILNGSQIPGDWVAGLQIVSSENSSIMGLRISNFQGPGIAISGGSKNNVIGGDRNLGSGPFGQGNQVVNNLVGVDLATNNTAFNIITGNLIGTDFEGVENLGNQRNGISFSEETHDNTVGPDNIIAFNGECGVGANDTNSINNAVTQNKIVNNGDIGICLTENFDSEIAEYCSDCTIEITDETLMLQEGNNSQGFLLSPLRSQDLLNNHIGAWFENFDRYYDTDFVYRNGFKRIRIGSLAGKGRKWLTVVNAGTLSDEVDKTISEYADQGIEIELILASGAGLPFNSTRFQSEQEFEQYLEYVTFVVSHFKGRIKQYEIWNEPGHIPFETYAVLVEKTAAVIRGIDPEAKIIIGAIQGNWDNDYPGYGEFQRFNVDRVYLEGLLKTGVAHLVDGISWHPFYDNIPSDPYYQNYPEMFKEIKDLATSQGFTGEYFVDEIMWTTVDEPNWDNGPPVSQLIGAKYLTRTITEHRGLGANVTINTYFQNPFLAPIHNLCNTMAGAEPIDLQVLLDTDETVNMRFYSFEMPNGEKLVALWTNDEALEEGSGVSTSITLSNLSAQKVVGIDIFNGFEQELFTENDNGDLVIRNLLVKDYPIYIKISGSTSS
jgi:hypothetical protein